MSRQAPPPILDQWADQSTGLVSQVWQDWLDEYVRPGTAGRAGDSIFPFYSNAPVGTDPDTLRALVKQTNGSWSTASGYFLYPNTESIPLSLPVGNYQSIPLLAAWWTDSGDNRRWLPPVPQPRS